MPKLPKQTFEITLAQKLAAQSLFGRNYQALSLTGKSGANWTFAI
jgi:hypothetical protein